MVGFDGPVHGFLVRVRLVRALVLGLLVLDRLGGVRLHGRFVDRLACVVEPGQALDRVWGPLADR